LIALTFLRHPFQVSFHELFLLPTFLIWNSSLKFNSLWRSALNIWQGQWGPSGLQWPEIIAEIQATFTCQLVSVIPIYVKQATILAELYEVEW
jgi:hypothetical protein